MPPAPLTPGGVRVAQVQSPTAVPGDASLSHPCAIAEGQTPGRSKKSPESHGEHDGKMMGSEENRFKDGLVWGLQSVIICPG